jgi:hypothetical protein
LTNNLVTFRHQSAVVKVRLRRNNAFRGKGKIHRSRICAKSMGKDLLGRAAEAADEEERKKRRIKRKSR